MSRVYGNAKQIKEIVETIYGLAVILEEDGMREGSDGPPGVFSPFHHGVINTAIKQLAVTADQLAEEIEGEERRLAELSAQRDDCRGGES